MHEVNNMHGNPKYFTHLEIVRMFTSPFLRHGKYLFTKTIYSQKRLQYSTTKHETRVPIKLFTGGKT
jgi:hypothetical protein